MKSTLTGGLLAAAVCCAAGWVAAHAEDAVADSTFTRKQWEQQGVLVSFHDSKLTKATFRSLPTPDTIRLLQKVDTLKEIGVLLKAPADGDVGILDANLRFSDAHLRLLCGLSQIESLDLSNTGVTDAGFAEISNLQNLRSLKLSGCKSLTVAAMPEILKLSNLVELQLASRMSDAAVQALLDHPHLPGRLQVLWTPGLQGQPFAPGSWSRLTDLRSLMLLGEPASTSIDEIVTLPRLQTVSLGATHDRGETYLSDEQVRKFAALPELVEFTPPIDSTGYVLKEFADCPKLREVTIGQRSLLFPNFSQLRQLERLRISGYHFSLGSSDIAAITNLTNLKLLSISGQEDNDALIAELPVLKQLENLDLLNGAVSPAGLAPLADLPRLEVLIMPMDQTLTDGHFAQIARIRSLRILFPLEIPQVTDAGIGALASLPDLEKLELLDARQLTDACLPALARMSKLTGLYIEGCAITPAGAKQLQTALPYTKINIVTDPTR